MLYHFFYNLWIPTLAIPASRPLWALYVGVTWAPTFVVLVRHGVSLQGRGKRREQA